MSKYRIPSVVLAAATLGPAFAGDGRIPIWQPTTITAPGHYVATRDITSMAGSPVIDIAADNVDIDLNGFTLSGAAGAPVVQSLGRDNVSIRRGKLMGGAYGVLMTSLTGGTHVTIEDLTVEGWTGFGIWLDGTTGFSIRRNKIGGPGVGEGIFAFTSFGGRTSGVIEGNQVFNGAGITVQNGGNILILNNSLHDTAPVPARGAISCEYCNGGRIVGNTVRYSQGSGIVLSSTEGFEVRDNSIDIAFQSGIVVEGDGNLVLENVVKSCSVDAVRIGGNANHIERNLLVGSGASGVGWGLHFTPGAMDNTYGRNTARRSSGGFCLPGGGQPATTDFCDESLGNSSFNDNYMPTLF